MRSVIKIHSKTHSFRSGLYVQHVLKYAHEYNKVVKASKVATNVTKEVVLVGWKPPPTGWVNLNTYDTCKRDEIARCGGVIRGSDGEWICDFAKGVDIMHIWQSCGGL